MDSQGAAAEDPAGPLERYMQILEVLAAFPGALTLGDVAALLELPKTTAHRLLRGLARSGLAKGGGNRPYELGERLMRLLHASADDGWLTSLVRPHLRALTDSTGETCYITRLMGARVVVVASLSPDARWRGYVQPDVEMPINAAASAKAIMAYQSKAVIEEALSHELPTLTANTQNDRVWIEQQLAETRHRGYATCIGEIDEGLAAIAVPIKLSNGMVLHSVAMTGPLQRIMNDQLADRLRALRGAADALAASLSIGERLKRTREISRP
ncbi:MULTISPECIES: IclR family transcriptional regulator C-terminal domain-containing protein [unclassified Bradyrhizobium]|uniref:IclR family transcriptional regulator n=1 Tax=unclassified Bradyrhizobium TaxID=2631580 RepID=UPI0024783F7F|nr:MULTISPECIES: IclR family transcriptional regulator C-terminal domain-containing protein [unclassified Bradyrhizobium]WGS19228.1 helix-turn-helix domain-containing protein [Bradyrhizobium sp. ISRA463]WGS26065.1 helix-turn-helix domain-containing protein [Bradyrhizobium sp. ISRA464]